MPSLRAVLGYDSAVYKARYTCVAVNNAHQHFPAAALQAGSATAFEMSTFHVRKGQMHGLAESKRYVILLCVRPEACML